MKNPKCYQCGKKRSRWPKGEDATFCSMRCAADAGMELPEATDRWWCEKCDEWTQDSQAEHECVASSPKD